MQQVYHFFQNTIGVNILFFFLTFIGFGLSFYFFKKSLKEKKPVFNHVTWQLLYSLKPLNETKLEIKYNGNPVKNMAQTTFAFWNSGKESIKAEDAVQKAPLVLKYASDIIIFDFEIINQNLINNFSIEKLNAYTLAIKFDFIDYNDGIILKVLHSGSNNPWVGGAFIGAKKISLGIRSKKLLDIFDKVFNPVNMLMNKKSRWAHILGFIIALPIFFISLPFIIVLMPIDFFLNRFNNTFDKKYLLNQ